jgi:hypothetical protein
MSYDPKKLLELTSKYANFTSDSLLKEGKKKSVKKDKKKIDPKAKVRHRGDVCVPASSALDSEDHFPINSEDQARNALSQMGKYDKAPPWYKGSLEGLKALISRKVHSKYPSIGKSDKKSSLETLLSKYGQKVPSKSMLDLYEENHRKLQEDMKIKREMEPSKTKPEPVGQKCVFCKGKGYKGPLGDTCEYCEGSGFHEPWTVDSFEFDDEDDQYPADDSKLAKLNSLLSKYSKACDCLEADDCLHSDDQDDNDSFQANTELPIEDKSEEPLPTQAPAPFVATPEGKAQAPVVKRPAAYIPPPDYKPDYVPPPDYKPEEDVPQPASKTSSPVRISERLLNKYGQYVDSQGKPVVSNVPAARPKPRSKSNPLIEAAQKVLSQDPKYARLLGTTGPNRNGVDGFMGNNTRAALRAWKTENGPQMSDLEAITTISGQADDASDSYWEGRDSSPFSPQSKRSVEQAPTTPTPSQQPVAAPVAAPITTTKVPQMVPTPVQQQDGKTITQPNSPANIAWALKETQRFIEDELEKLPTIKRSGKALNNLNVARSNMSQILKDNQIAQQALNSYDEATQRNIQMINNNLNIILPALEMYIQAMGATLEQPQQPQQRQPQQPKPQGAPPQGQWNPNYGGWIYPGGGYIMYPGGGWVGLPRGGRGYGGRRRR